MQTSNIFSFFHSSSQFSDIASNEDTHTGTVHATSPSSPPPPQRSTPGSGTQHHRNFTDLPQLRAGPSSGFVVSRKEQKIGGALHAATGENNHRGIRDFAVGELEKISLDQRLAWLRNLGADKAMRKTMSSGSADVIEAWTEVVQRLPAASRYAFLGEKITEGTIDHDDRNSIATAIFSNTQADAMKAWGKLLELVPDRNRERSKLLLARMDHRAEMPALALLFERGEKQALDQFVGLATQHVWHGDEHIHQVLLDCLPTMKILTSQRGDVCEGEAPDWVGTDELKYGRPYELSATSRATAHAFGKLVRLVPRTHRNDIFFPKAIWTTFPGRHGDARQLKHDQARELAHSITLLKAMVPIMSAGERETVLNEIRSRHATKTVGLWKNTSSYEIFKKTWPALDAMLLDLKVELKKVPSY